MKKILIFLLVALNVLGVNASASNLSSVTANSYYLAQIDEENVLTQQGSSVSLAPNEFSKLMTALVCMQKFYPGDWLTFKQEPLVFHNSYGNIANQETGVKMKIRHHLANMLLLYSDASATEMAIAYSGSVKAFTDEMNKKAQELGMKDTVFTSPCGYDVNGSSKTTIQDLYILAKAVYADKDIMEILKKDKFEMPVPDGVETFSSRNHLISRYTFAEYTYSAANGMIASRSDGSQSIIATAEKNGSALVVIIANAPDDNSIYKDTINLFEHGFKNFYPREICSEGDIIEQASVPNAKNGFVRLVAEKNVTALLPVGYSKDKITVTVDAKDNLSAPIKKNTKAGTATYYYDDSQIAKVNLVVEKDIEKSVISYIYNKFLSKINVLLVIAILLFIIFVIVQRNKAIKKKKAKRARFEELKRL
jgi:D-alanyl-D-alanine carboxypeptidase/D-alanyl-D-alanine carboxypeptidase (penicillin-binding protein 5/6)